MNENSGVCSRSSDFSVSRFEHRFLDLCILVAVALLCSIILIQSYRYEIFGTTLMLGWDSPGYVWLARYVLNAGPAHMIQAWSFPYLYVQLLAFLGYACGDLVLVERILPVTFCILLIYLNATIILKISKSVYLAGLAAFLTVFSVNFLRLFSDLNGNLMALSLAFATFLFVPNLEREKPLLNKKYLSFILILFIIACTHFETYFVLGLSLLLYCLISRNWQKSSRLIIALAIPVVVLISAFPAYFFGYMNTLVILYQPLTFGDIILWNGGSWLLLCFWILGSYFVYRSKTRNNALVSLVYSWSLVNLLIVVSLGPISREFAMRSLYVMPTPLLLVLAVFGFKNCLMNRQSRSILSISKMGHSVRIHANQVLVLLAVCIVAAGSVFTVVSKSADFLTTFLPYSTYEKIVKVEEYFEEHNLSKPIVVFGGYPNRGLVILYRNYIGAEIGEHFAYYGDIPNLFHLLPSLPRVNSTADPYISQLEKYYLTSYYYELTGNLTAPVPPMYYHDSHVTNETLLSYPIIIVTPDFYAEEIPDYIKPFYVGDGIYIIPPNSISPSEIK
jgi:hypothetical protein